MKDQKVHPFLVLLLLVIWTPAHAALVAMYDFDNSDATDSSGSANAYDLSASAGTVAPTYVTENGNTFVHFAGRNNVDGQALLTAPNALVPGDDDGNSDWIVSLWFRTDDWSQGNYRGIFATADNNNDSRGWQIDSTGGAGRVIVNDNGTTLKFNAWTSQPTIDAWHHLYLIKRSNLDWDLYLDGTAVIAPTTGNVGRVDEIRLGTIRNGINSLRLDMDYVQIWDGITDPGSDLATVYSAGRSHIGIIPEPSSLALVLAGFALPYLWLRRRTR